MGNFTYEGIHMDNRYPITIISFSFILILFTTLVGCDQKHDPTTPQPATLQDTPPSSQSPILHNMLNAAAAGAAAGSAGAATSAVTNHAINRFQERRQARRQSNESKPIHRGRTYTVRPIRRR